MMATERSARLITLLVVAGVAGLLALFGRDPSVSEAVPPDLTGIACMDLYLDLDPLQAKGTPHGTEDPLVGKILSRIEASTAQPGGWDVTSIAYTGPDLNQDLIPDKPPSSESCKQKGDGNELNSSVAFQVVDVSVRPTATAKLVTKGLDENLEYSVCQFEEELLGGTWVLNEFEIVVDGDPQTQDYGILTAYLDPGSCTTGAGLVFNTVIESTSRTATKGEPDPVLPDDWDGDGCTDWDELNPDGPSRRGVDPFNPIDCAVGGIAELLEVARTPVATSDSSGWGAGLVIGVALAIAAAAIVLGGAGWYAARGRPR